MRSLGLHLMLAAIGIAGITTQAMTGSPDGWRPAYARPVPAVTMPSTAVMHEAVKADLPIVDANLS